MPLTTDSFNRADNPSSLGSTDGTGTLDPKPWVVRQGTLGIIGNQAYTSALVGGNPSIATIDLGTSLIDCSLTVGVGNIGTGIAFRYADLNNYWFWRNAATFSDLYKVVAGVLTRVGTAQSGALNGDVLRVVAQTAGDVAVYRNGVSMISTTDTFNQNLTHFGLRLESTTQRADNWTAQLTPLTTTVVGGKALETDTANSGLILVDTTVVGGKAIEQDIARDGTSMVLPAQMRFTPPTELTVSNIAYDAPNPIANRLRRYYPLGKRGRAVFKLPDGSYTFHQPYPWVTAADVGTPSKVFPDPPIGQGDSTLKRQTVDLVYYGGHEHVISQDEAARLSVFLTAEGYNPQDWLEVIV